MIKNIGIIGTGYAVPSHRVGPSDFLKQGTPAQLIEDWDIGEHREATTETATDLEAEAAKMAIARAGLTPLDIDLIIGTTLLPEKVNPSNASLTQWKIGAKNAAVFGLDMACIGAVPALMTADALFRAGKYKKILVLGSCQLRAANDETDPAVYAVCGDGAGAVVLSEVESSAGIIATHLEANGEHWQNVGIETKASKCPVPGRADEKKQRFYIDHDRSPNREEFFKWAMGSVPNAALRLLEKEGLTIKDIDWVCPHQNVKPVSGRWMEMLGVPKERIIETRKEFGNMGPANVLVNLHRGAELGRFKPGDRILLLGQGSGMSVGVALLRWSAAAKLN